MEKSTGIKISSVFLTALALLNFRAAVANSVICPQSYTGTSCKRYCSSHIQGHATNIQLFVQNHGGYGCHYSLVPSPSGATAMSNTNHPWQGKRPVSASVSPVAKKLLAARDRGEFIAKLEDAEKAGGIQLTEARYDQLKAKSTKFKMILPKATWMMIKNQRMAVITADAIRTSLTSDHSREADYQEKR
ncbi:MAG: hypothetical protein K0S08_1989 [Gammaproteobacteria bacterium]|nr:hypothetical protein [Gammaproteobacteria bacterium]MCE3238240.1 hypothetical protein [Gammaproteobacteria bacterium]